MNAISAQYGFGFGEMMFGMGMRTVPSPTDFLNQHSLAAANRGMQGPTQNRAYGPGSNSFHNNVRDNGFVSTGELSRRRIPVSSRTQSVRSTANTARTENPRPTPVANASPPKPAVPQLISFFDQSLRLMWPSESPVAGELKEKRRISDTASLAVLQETKQAPFASPSTVADARKKLLDYGRPALQEIRTSSTAPIAEAFHQFMLSLYDSLARAGEGHR
ncbi:MAG: hypothetical protein ABS79_07790 [Planctomycetes bacterium SCN 63-9]|nr:MAG: hypothetical protein ABS79_07790 [Planctomycetes bacterium SCN 63-9]